ncbi:MAG: hypothetical protein BWX86_00258 [Verrucomicrobia bacterium ADurb.Bin122]|nr:MAG: hypothetical protein BWX86_00258 [Verrucomicrobia bacterium ADurb.Bin122]
MRQLVGETSQEGLDTARSQRTSAQDDPRSIVQRIVLGLVTEHRLVAPVVFEIDARRQAADHARQQPLRLGEIRLRREVDAIGIGFEDRAALALEGIDQRLEELAAARRHLGGEGAVSEARPRKAEVAVERVDQDFEIRLARLRLGTLFGGGRRARELFEAQPVLAQRAQQRDENAECIVGRVASDLEQQARVQRGHVEVQHVAEDAFVEAPREAAFEGFHLRRQRDRMPGVVVLFQKEQVDLGRRPAQRSILELERKGLCLLEIGRQQQIGESLRLAQIVAQIGDETLAIRPVGRVDRVAGQVRTLGAVFGGDAEVDGEIFETKRRELAPREVVQLHEQIRVDDRASGQVAAGEIDPALGHFQAAFAKGRALSEAAPGARHFQAGATLAQVIEVEAEQIVPLNHVGIFLGERGVERLQQALLGGVVQVLQHEQPVAPARSQTDRQHTIFGALGVAERAVLRRRFDVELAPAQLPKCDIGKQACPVLHEELALELVDGIVRALADCALHGIEQIGVRHMDQARERPVARQRFGGRPLNRRWRRIDTCPCKRAKPRQRVHHAPAVRGACAYVHDAALVHPQPANLSPDVVDGHACREAIVADGIVAMASSARSHGPKAGRSKRGIVGAKPLRAWDALTTSV